MKTGAEFAAAAMQAKWNGIKYNQLDCQAFVEEVLKDIGITKPDGSFYNWKGSNSMYRNFYQWRGTKEECINKFGCVPLGAFVYIWRETGAELVGYYDDLGNLLAFIAEIILLAFIAEIILLEIPPEAQKPGETE